MVIVPILITSRHLVINDISNKDNNDKDNNDKDNNDKDNDKPVTPFVMNVLDAILVPFLLIKIKMKII